MEITLHGYTKSASLMLDSLGVEMVQFEFTLVNQVGETGSATIPMPSSAWAEYVQGDRYTITVAKCSGEERAK